MAKRPTTHPTARPSKTRTGIDDQLAQLSALRHLPSGTEAPVGKALELVRKALASKNNFVVAAAAVVVADTRFAELRPLLPEAFGRFMEDGAETDKTCRAKLAIANTLQQVESDDPAVFLKGIRCVQREPVWGGSVDTAAELRGVCALGLAQMDHPEAGNELARLLADPEPAARANAARAVGSARKAEGIPLLRYKVLIGDSSPEVLTESFAALLDLAPAGSLPFVTSFLHPENVRQRNPEKREETEIKAEAAALALGQSRLPDAFEPLKQWNETFMPGERRISLLSLGMLRTPPAVDYLMSTITGEPAAAPHAVAALALQRNDAALRKRVQQAIHEAGEGEGRRNERALKALREAFEEGFSEGVS